MQPTLVYLGFFRQAVMKAVASISCLYSYGKDSSGALKPGVDRVEGTVNTVLGPVVSKLNGKPDELLVFIDSKVREAFLEVSFDIFEYEGIACSFRGDCMSLQSSILESWIMIVRSPE